MSGRFRFSLGHAVPPGHPTTSVFAIGTTPLTGLDPKASLPSRQCVRVLQRNRQSAHAPEPESTDLGIPYRRESGGKTKRATRAAGGGAMHAHVTCTCTTLDASCKHQTTNVCRNLAPEAPPGRGVHGGCWRIELAFLLTRPIPTALRSATPDFYNRRGLRRRQMFASEVVHLYRRCAGGGHPQAQGARLPVAARAVAEPSLCRWRASVDRNRCARCA